MDLLQAIFSPDIIYSAIRVTTPILFAALGALISDKAGVINIGLEGIMLICALGGVIASAYTGSAMLGFLFAIALGGFLGYLIAYMYLKLKTDIILAGIAMNLFAFGITVIVLEFLTGDKGSSISLASKVMPNVNIPFIGRPLSGHNVLTYVAFISVFVVWFLLYKTPLGLRIRATGESPNAAVSVGISVSRIQTISLVFSGMFTAMGGAYLSMGYVSNFSVGMTSGRGFIALAAESMGNASPLGTMLASLLFGASDALANFLQSLSLPPDLINMLPYVMSVVGLVVYSIIRVRRSNKKNKIN